MHPIDWLVLSAVLLFIVLYGIWKTRSIKTAEGFLVGGKKSPWWMVGLSIMATQASAITFLSTPGQAYHDGLGFVQFYLALPLAMVILCIFVLPRFFAMNVYTAYEYLESRFGLSTRVLTAFLFLLQRGLAAGITIFAPAIILSTILGWNLAYTNLLIGVVVIIYTLIGGTEAVSQTQKQQMLVIFIGMVIAFATILDKLPISFGEALHLSGSLGKLNAVDYKFDLSEKYNIWSAFLGGTFLFLSYFGTDQSQVQRYLSGESLQQARLGLLFNGLFKVPMQFFILLTGVLVFVFFQFQKSPVHFNPIADTQFVNDQAYQDFQETQATLFDEKQATLNEWIKAKKKNKKEELKQAEEALRQNHEQELALRESVREHINQFNETSDKRIEANDKDYVFIHFILNYLPQGLVGLLLAVILSAAMSSTASELNALATTTVVDIYKRNFAPNISDKQYLLASRLFTLFWGLVAIFFAIKASLFENLIQAVNIIGSLFYGVILGVFAIAFLFPKIKGKAVIISIFIVEPIVVLLYLLDAKPKWFHPTLQSIDSAGFDTSQFNLEFLWLNPIGCLLLIAVAYLIQVILGSLQSDMK